MTTTVVVQSNGTVIGYDGLYTGPVQPNTDGSVTIDTRDLPDAMRGGFVPVYTQVRSKYYSAPAAASATGIVNNVTTTNVALTIADQPDVGRQLQIVTAPGSPGITAGNLALTYTANDGTTQVDNFSLIGAATTTPKSSKGCLHLTSAVVSGLVGGTSPTIEIGTNGTLSVDVQPNTKDATILKEGLDGVDVAAVNVGVLTSGGLYTPHTAPNGTHNFQLDYTTLSVGT